MKRRTFLQALGLTAIAAPLIKPDFSQAKEHEAKAYKVSDVKGYDYITDTNTFKCNWILKDKHTILARGKEAAISMEYIPIISMEYIPIDVTSIDSPVGYREFATRSYVQRTELVVSRYDEVLITHKLKEGGELDLEVVSYENRKLYPTIVRCKINLNTIIFRDDFLPTAHVVLCARINDIITIDQKNG